MQKKNLSAGQTFASAVASRDDQHLMKQELQTKEIVDPRNNGRNLSICHKVAATSMRESAGVEGRQLIGLHLFVSTSYTSELMTWDSLICRLFTYDIFCMRFHRGLTSTRYPTRPKLFFCYPNPTRTIFHNLRV